MAISASAWVGFFPPVDCPPRCAAAAFSWALRASLMLYSRSRTCLSQLPMRTPRFSAWCLNLPRQPSRR